jgi:hypothetical protein
VFAPPLITGGIVLETYIKSFSVAGGRKTKPQKIIEKEYERIAEKVTEGWN